MPTADRDRRFLIRVAQQPDLRLDTNDYSLDPHVAGRCVEVRVSQTEITAIVLDSGELACRHRRRFARHLTFPNPAHHSEFEPDVAARGAAYPTSRSSCART